MRRFRISLALVLSLAGFALPSRGETPPAADARAFEGVWLGEITGPHARTTLGLAFTPTPDGLLVSVQMPEMFLYSVNFGPADIRDGAFTLAPLHLRVAPRGDTLTGTFSPARFPVKLRRGDSFPPAPAESDYPAAPAPRWTRSLGAPAWATPVAHAGVIYASAIDGKIHAVRAADGAELWTWTGPHPLYGEPLVTASALYFVDERCDLVALSRSDGALLWRSPLHDPAFAPRLTSDPTFNHRTATPVTDERGTLYVGSTDGGLYAVRQSSGKILWRHPAQAPIYAPVALVRDEVLAATFDGSIFALNRRSRREIRRTQLGGAIVSAPVIASDRILVGSRDYQLYTLASNGAVLRSQSYWFSWVESTPRVVDGVAYIGGSDYRRVSAFDLATGDPRWATDVRGLSWGSPLVASDTVFAGTAGQTLEGTVIKHVGGILALDRATGAVRWHYRPTPTPGAAFTGFAGSLALVGDLVIGASVDGTLVALPSGTPPTPAPFPR